MGINGKGFICVYFFGLFMLVGKLYGCFMLFVFFEKCYGVVINGEVVW